MKWKHLLAALCYALSLTSAALHGADTVTPDLKAIPSGKGWSLTPGYKAEVVDLNGKAAVRIVVEGAKVRLYVDGAAEPCLAVKESLSGRVQGGVGLWTWSGGAFANLKITPRK